MWGGQTLSRHNKLVFRGLFEDIIILDQGFWRVGAAVATICPFSHTHTHTWGPQTGHTLTFQASLVSRSKAFLQRFRLIVIFCVSIHPFTHPLLFIFVRAWGGSWESLVRLGFPEAPFQLRLSFSPSGFLSPFFLILTFPLTFPEGARLSCFRSLTSIVLFLRSNRLSPSKSPGGSLSEPFGM